MNRKLKEDEKVKAIDGLVKPYGMKCIEYTEKYGRSSLSISTYFVKDGLQPVSTDDLDRCYNVIYPYLQLSKNKKDIFLEVSSAGAERKIKDVYEFVLFKGMPVRVYDAVKSDWVGGTIGECDEQGVFVNSADASEKVLFDNIKKANLVYSAGSGDGEKT